METLKIGLLRTQLTEEIEQAFAAAYSGKEIEFVTLDSKTPAGHIINCQGLYATVLQGEEPLPNAAIKVGHLHLICKNGKLCEVHPISVDVTPHNPEERNRLCRTAEEAATAIFLAFNQFGEGEPNTISELWELVIEKVKEMIRDYTPAMHSQIATSINPHSVDDEAAKLYNHMMRKAARNESTNDEYLKTMAATAIVIATWKALWHNSMKTQTMKKE